MTCTCQSFYIGKAKRTLWQLISDHVQTINQGNLKSPLGRMFMEIHSYNHRVCNFQYLERVHPNIRRESHDKETLNWEARWIYVFEATKIPGRNDQFNFAKFFGLRPVFLFILNVKIVI